MPSEIFLEPSLLSFDSKFETNSISIALAQQAQHQEMRKVQKVNFKTCTEIHGLFTAFQFVKWRFNMQMQNIPDIWRKMFNIII